MRTKQVRPEKLDFEYELYIYRSRDELLGKQYITFDFRTKKVFENFAYRINVVSAFNQKKKELSFNIEGLSAPLLDFSRSGPAYHIYRFFNFEDSDYELFISKYRKKKTHFRMRVSRDGIKMLQVPEDRFINVITEVEGVS